MDRITVIFASILFILLSPRNVAGLECGHGETMTADESQPWLVKVMKGNAITCTGLLIQMPEVGPNDQKPIHTHTRAFVTPDDCVNEVLASDKLLINGKEFKDKILGVKVAIERNIEPNRKAAVVLFADPGKLLETTIPVCIDPKPIQGSETSAELALVKAGEKEPSITYIRPSVNYPVCKVSETSSGNTACQKPLGKGSPLILYREVKTTHTVPGEPQKKKNTILSILSFKNDKVTPPKVIELLTHTAYVVRFMTGGVSSDGQQGQDEVPVLGVIHTTVKELQVEFPELVTLYGNCYGTLVRVPVESDGVPFTTVAVTSKECTEKWAKNTPRRVYIGSTRINVLGSDNGNEKEGSSSQQVSVLQLEANPMFIQFAGGYRLSNGVTDSTMKSLQAAVASGRISSKPATPSGNCQKQLKPLVGEAKLNAWLCVEPASPQYAGLPYYFQQQPGPKTITGISVGNDHYMASVNVDKDWIIQMVHQWHSKGNSDPEANHAHAKP